MLSSQFTTWGDLCYVERLKPTVFRISLSCDVVYLYLCLWSSSLPCHCAPMRYNNSRPSTKVTIAERVPNLEFTSISGWYRYRRKLWTWIHSRVKAWSSCYTQDMCRSSHWWYGIRVRFVGYHSCIYVLTLSFYSFGRRNMHSRITVLRPRTWNGLLYILWCSSLTLHCRKRRGSGSVPKSHWSRVFYFSKM